MKSLKYLNFVLTAIAVCLVILTISVIGAFPEASANANAKKNAKLPFEKDKTADTVVQVVKGDLIRVLTTQGETMYISKNNILNVKASGFKLQVVLTGGITIEVREYLQPFVNRVNK